MNTNQNVQLDYHVTNAEAPRRLKMHTLKTVQTRPGLNWQLEFIVYLFEYMTLELEYFESFVSPVLSPDDWIEIVSGIWEHTESMYMPHMRI